MSSFSAAQAISPAIARTRQFLFEPFRLGRLLKLTLVAVLTEGGFTSCNFNSHFPSGNPGGSGVPWHMPVIHWPAVAAMVAISVLVMLIVIPIGICIAYLLIRLRFSYFDCLLYRQDQIAPAWARYHRQAMRYLGLSLSIGLAWWVILIPVGYSIYQHFKPLFASLGSDHPPGLLEFLPLIATLVPVLTVVALATYLVETAQTCFVLPRMAIEDASIRSALEEVWDDIVAEPGQFALFYLLRFLLSLAATILAFLALLIPVVVVALIGVVFVLILKTLSTGLAVTLGILAGILVFVLFLLAIIALGGAIGTFRRNYAMLFYGGRYPELAMLLWPPPPAPAPPPIAPPLPPFDDGMASGFVPGA